MTKPMPPTEHKEIDFFDEIEKELVALTTATLEDEKSSRKTVIVPVPFPASSTRNTVILAKERTHPTHEGSDDTQIAATQKRVGSPPAPGVMSVDGRNNKYHRNNE